MAVVVVIVPVWLRPHRAALLVDSVCRATEAGRWRVLFVGTEGDTAEHDACRATGCDLMILPGEHRPGDYARKINHAYRNSDEPLLFLGADDLSFRPGWLTAACRGIDAGYGVVGTNDLGNPRVTSGTHATHSLVARRYVDRYGTIDEPGLVLHEGYEHEWCDDEFVGTAKLRCEWSFAADSIVEHLHPNWADSDGNPKAPMDPLYADQRRRMLASRELFRQRRRLWLYPRT